MAGIAVQEAKFTSHQLPLSALIGAAQKKTLIDQQQHYDEVKQIMQGKGTWEEKQSKLYQRLVQMVYENKRVDNYLEDYHKKMAAAGKLQKQVEYDLGSVRMKNENTKQQLSEVTAQNQRLQEDIEKKAHEIQQKRAEQHTLFKVALETIMRRLKDYERDCDEKGITIEKFGHLDQVAEEEQAKIILLNQEIQEVDKAIKECQKQYKVIVQQDLEDFQEQRTHLKQKYEEAKQRSHALNLQLDDFKRRFMQQSKQMHANKQRHKQLDADGYRVIEQKNYLEKENQELEKQRENMALIKANLECEVEQFKRDSADLTERKRQLEEFIMVNMR